MSSEQALVRSDLGAAMGPFGEDRGRNADPVSWRRHARYVAPPSPASSADVERRSFGVSTGVHLRGRGRETAPGAATQSFLLKEDDHRQNIFAFTRQVSILRGKHSTASEI